MKILKNYFTRLSMKGWLNWLVFVVIMVALVGQVLENRNLSKSLDDARKQNVLLNTQTPLIKEATEISRQADSAGVEKVVYRLSDPIIEKIVDNSKIDSLVKVAGVRADRITSITTINAALVAENKKLRQIVNSKSDTVWEYRDRWLTNIVRLRDTTSSVWVDASVNKVDFDYKKFWVLGANEHRSTIWFNSPYIKPNGMETLSIKAKEPFFDVGVGVGTQYLQTPREVLVGPRLYIKLGRFNLRGGYMLNPYGNIGNTFTYGADYKLY